MKGIAMEPVQQVRNAKGEVRNIYRSQAAWMVKSDKTGTVLGKFYGAGSRRRAIARGRS